MMLQEKEANEEQHTRKLILKTSHMMKIRKRNDSACLDKYFHNVYKKATIFFSATILYNYLSVLRGFLIGIHSMQS